MKFDSKKDKIWFTADSHYWHKNLVYGESIWPSKETSTRRFNTTQEMSQHLVKQINKYVAEDDILIHGGDWSFGGAQNIWNFRKQLRVRRIYITPGNHDSHIKNNIILPNVHRPEPYSMVFVDGESIGGEYPDYIEAKSLFEFSDKVLEIEIDKNKLLISHYPYESWSREIHLHGHSHGTLEEKYNRLDIGIDRAFQLYGEYKPFSWENILEQIKRINDKNKSLKRH